ncbi:hypothetical protein BO99DRAFT_34825 [Aspergillus violaceofuscus CBS 115571]|uniref:Uncharacterized protein n=1 Tax=Aspergillus violaceofuscus (strain CBS 115571) TaxID=1450538 RepID=A0A2V5GTE9_ASPV1|nr:hypothetical protein BO99DRAFT_34825 [Aspergillus violaceofuscus CBS 115571]
MTSASETQPRTPIPRQSLVWGLTWPDDNDKTMLLLDKSFTRSREFTAPCCHLLGLSSILLIITTCVRSFLYISGFPLFL